MPFPLIPLIAGVAGLAGAGASIAGAVGSSEANEQNYKSQKELLKWQKSAQKTTWAREDNAVQRRMSDMRAAGISPHANAGGAAQASGPVGMKAPQRDASVPIKNAANMQQTINSVANIAQTLAQTQVLQAEGRIRNVGADVSESTKHSQISSIHSDAQIKSNQAQLSTATMQNSIKYAELVNEKLNLENKYSFQTMQARISEAVSKSNISKAEAKKIVDILEAKLNKDKASTYQTYKQAELTDQQISRLADLIPVELETAKTRRSMEILKVEDYNSLPPRARTTIMLLLGGLKAIF